jgi:hypothetical protein
MGRRRQPGQRTHLLAVLELTPAEELHSVAPGRLDPHTPKPEQPPYCIGSNGSAVSGGQQQR